MLVHIKWLFRLCICGALIGCGTLHSARPLDKGEHQVGATLGGPMVQFGGAYIPLPNIVVQGRSGISPVLDRPFDVDYGINLTGFAFGVMGIHGGVNWQLVHQDKAIPALTLSNRLWVQNNLLDVSKDWSKRTIWAADQIEFTLSYKFGKHLLYFGMAEYIDFRQPDLLLSPFIGTDLAASERLGIQVEVRYFAANQTPPVDTVTWLGPGSGAVGLVLGFRYLARKGGAE